jgi:hypothetical protein
MTANRASALGTLSPWRMALLLCAALVSLHLILLIGASLRSQTAERVQLQIQDARSNLSNLEVIELQEIDSLQAELSGMQTKLAELEQGAPAPGSSYAVYRRSFDHAVGLQAELVSISLTGTELQATVAGQVEADIYRLQLVADRATCLTLIGRLETEAGPTLAVDDLAVDAVNDSCAFTLAVVRLAE